MHHAYGTWRSPVSAEAVASQGLRLGGVSVDGDDIYWIEGRPAEGGRNVLVRCDRGGSITDITPGGFNVRTRVHEYGGDAYAVSGGTVYFSNFADQRVYCQRGGSPPAALTPEGAWFYADFAVDTPRRRLICVREDHTGDGEAVNAIVAISLDLDAATSAVAVLASGHDFYSTPRLSPDGRRLCWLAWRHPQMPWDGTELWVAGVSDSGGLENAARVAGGASESIYQPGWSPDGQLHYVSDRDGWWKLFRSEGSGRSDRSDRSDRSGSETAVLKHPPQDAEFGRPQWVFGTATWAFSGTARIVASYSQRGRWHLALIDVATGTWRPLDGDLEPHDWLAATATHAVLVAGSPASADALVRIAIDSGTIEVLRRASSLTFEPGDVSVAEPIAFPTADGVTAHAFYYAPRNSRHQAADGERPPLITIGHGGPTTAATGTFDPRIQYWTTRGFAVVDVNYRGSSGFGRVYRQRLDGQWGIADVADLVGAARYLVTAGKADPQRLIVRGGSAGGYTTLAALTFHAGVFNAGASYYGISDIEVLARDTHKFESRYLDGLVGPYPQALDVYRSRSPIHFVDRLACPLILFQGLEDKVVPPNQSAMMMEAARANGLPVAYLTFAGEQHGFRKAETIVRSLEAELFFYGTVFGFEPSDRIEPIHIDNLPGTHGAR